MKKYGALFLCLIITLTACGMTGDDDSMLRVSVYNTNQYYAYRRLNMLAANSLEDKVARLDEQTIVWNDKEYYTCEMEDIKLYVQYAEQSGTENAQVDYILLKEDEVIHEVTLNNITRWPSSVGMYCLDVNHDSQDDIIIVGEKDNYLNGWAYIYDVYNEQEISLFERNGDLPERFQKDIEEKLNKDKGFQNLFSYRGIGGQGNAPIFDEHGGVYCILPIWSEEYLPAADGEVMVLFEYDVKEHAFTIAEIMYMPYYVTE